MGKYASHNECRINAPKNCQEDTTNELSFKGMPAITPSGLNSVKIIPGRH